VGATKAYDQKNGITFWDIPYAPGKLEVVGMDDTEKEVIRHQIQSSKRQYAIKVVQQDQVQVNAKDGLAQIVLQVVDEDGVPVLLSDDEVTCDIVGNARLLGMEAGNNSDMTDYTDNKQRVFNGKMIVYVKGNGGSADEVSVRFTSPWLKTAMIKIKF